MSEKPNQTRAASLPSERQGGFTLIEMIFALVIMSGLALVVSDSYVHMARIGKLLNVRSVLVREGDELTEYLNARLEALGGGAVRPWQALWVENSCAARNGLPGCQQSDRMTTLESVKDASLPECGITNFTSASTAEIALVSGNCPLTPDFLGKQVVFTKDDYFFSKRISSLDIANCIVTLSNGQFEGGPNAMPTGWPAAPAWPAWDNGRMTVVRAFTYFLDRDSGELKTFTDADGDNTAAGTELSVITDRLVDFQLALGYDTAPRDGRITNSKNQNDEWLYNCPDLLVCTNTVEQFGVNGLVNATVEDLRMISIGVIVWAKNPINANPSLSVLDGPPRDSTTTANLKRELKTVQTRFRLRNLGIYLVGG